MSSSPAARATSVVRETSKSRRATFTKSCQKEGKQEARAREEAGDVPLTGALIVPPSSQLATGPPSPNPKFDPKLSSARPWRRRESQVRVTEPRTNGESDPRKVGKAWQHSASVKTEKRILDFNRDPNAAEENAQISVTVDLSHSQASQVNEAKQPTLELPIQASECLREPKSSNRR